MNALIGFLLSFILVILLCLCTDFGSEYRLGSTNFYFEDNQSFGSKYVIEKRKFQPKVVVPSAVIDYEVEKKNITLARQVVNSYSCENGAIATEFLDKYDYWVITDGRVTGPLDYVRFMKVIQSMKLGRSMILPKPSNLREDYAIRFLKLTDCDNPKLIPD